MSGHCAHYLAFDLLVGAWETTDARTHGVPHPAVLPCLALTFLFGPAGFLLYLGLRRVFARA
ncbi:MAG: abscisic acid-deficient protein Aba4 family protein [Gemmatimonadales bacterium]